MNEQLLTDESSNQLRLPLFNDREKVAQVARVMGRNEKGVIDFENFVAFIRAANKTVNKRAAAAAAKAAAKADAGGGQGGGGAGLP